MPVKKVPRSIALIPDGNRRWAKGHRLSILSSYKLGVQKFIEFSEWCREFGVKNITVWALSTENLKRPRHELGILFNLYKRAAKDPKILARLNKNKTRFNIVGDRDVLPYDVRTALESLEYKTKTNKGRVINMLVGYGGREDILHGAREYAKEALRVGKAIALTDATFKKFLRSYSIPEIDFVIRTSSEERVSGLLPWQIGYSELYFADKYWPDFSKRDLEMALLEYGKRIRRFGT